MLRRLASVAAVAATWVARVQANAPTCGAGSLCPADTPCCSTYGQCGVGAFCLGGCNPLFSHDFNSCAPEPVCSSTNYTFHSSDGKTFDRFASIDDYLGDASNVDWVYTGNPVPAGDSLALTMAEDTVGTLVASSHYVWYGKICASLATSQGKGVVTAFIMMSDVKDEIDFEFVGVDIANTQTNFYSQGVPDYNNEKNLSVGTTTNYNTYCIDWQPDTLTWSVNGNGMRTLKRSDTWNATANRFDYPQTPSRIELSLWPAGLPSEAEGTRDWSGGTIDWNSPYMKNGYYAAGFAWVSVSCYDPPAGANQPGKKTYQFTNAAGTNDTVEISDNVVVLSSLDATGDKPGSASSSAAGSKATGSTNNIPGGVGGGGGRAGDATSASGSTGATATTSGQATGFSQGGSQSGAAAGVVGGETMVRGGSAVAVIVAVLALVVL